MAQSSAIHFQCQACKVVLIFVTKVNRKRLLLCLETEQGFVGNEIWWFQWPNVEQVRVFKVIENGDFSIISVRKDP